MLGEGDSAKCWGRKIGTAWSLPLRRPPSFGGASTSNNKNQVINMANEALGAQRKDTEPALRGRARAGRPARSLRGRRGAALQPGRGQRGVTDPNVTFRNSGMRVPPSRDYWWWLLPGDWRGPCPGATFIGAQGRRSPRHGSRLRGGLLPAQPYPERAPPTLWGPGLPAWPSSPDSHQKEESISWFYS